MKPICNFHQSRRSGKEQSITSVGDGREGYGYNVFSEFYWNVI